MKEVDTFLGEVIKRGAHGTCFASLDSFYIGISLFLYKKRKCESVPRKILEETGLRAKK